MGGKFDFFKLASHKKYSNIGLKFLEIVNRTVPFQ